MDKQEIIERIKDLKERLRVVRGTPCETYSRIVGYFRPLKQWNAGKTEEYHDRVTFDTREVNK